MRCNFKTLSSLCTKTNSRNGFYTKNTMNNGTGNVSVSQIAVELYRFWFCSPKTFFKVFYGGGSKLQEISGGLKIFSIPAKKTVPRYNLNFALAGFFGNIPRYNLKIRWRSFLPKIYLDDLHTQPVRKTFLLPFLQ